MAEEKKEISYRSTKTSSTFTVSGTKDRAYLVVTGEASTNAKVMREVARIRTQGEVFKMVDFIARQYAATY